MNNASFRAILTSESKEIVVVRLADAIEDMDGIDRSRVPRMLEGVAHAANERRTTCASNSTDCPWLECGDRILDELLAEGISAYIGSSLKVDLEQEHATRTCETLLQVADRVYR